MLVHPSMMRVL